MNRNVVVTGVRLITAVAIFGFGPAKADRTGQASEPVPAPRVQSEPAGGASQQAPPVDVGGLVAVSCTLAGAEVSLHEPVLLNFAVENNLSQPVKFDLGQNRKASFSFTITQPDGQRVELPQYSIMGLSRHGAVRLKADQTYRQSLLLNEWFEFRSAGNYEIQVRLSKPIQTRDGRAISTQTEFLLPLKVAARNPGRLEAVCAELAAQVAAADSYDKAAEATLALGHINDPVAVPYLEKALAAGKLVEQIAVAGLERNGSAEAVEALLSALNTQPDEVQIELIRPALVRIKEKVSDPALRQKVEQALRNRP
jgi:hypothetical protein